MKRRKRFAGWGARRRVRLQVVVSGPEAAAVVARARAVGLSVSGLLARVLHSMLHEPGQPQ